MTLSRVTPESPCPKFEMIMKTGARDLFAFQVFLVCGLAGAGIPKCLFKTGFLWKCRSDFHMLCMKWVVQMPVSYVWSSNTGPASMRYQSGWRHCLQLGQTSWAGLLFYTLRCLLLYLRPPSNPPLSNKYHYITGPNSDQLQSTAHGQHISPPFTLTRLCTCPTSTLHCSGTRFSVIVADLYAHSVAYHDRR